MSKHDFTEAEFRDRQARVRRAVAEAGLDWLIVFHPVSIHWLIGAETKSYQAFQCLPVPAQKQPLVMFTRESAALDLAQRRRTVAEAEPLARYEIDGTGRQTATGAEQRVVDGGGNLKLGSAFAERIDAGLHGLVGDARGFADQRDLRRRLTSFRSCTRLLGSAAKAAPSRSLSRT